MDIFSKKKKSVYPQFYLHILIMCVLFYLNFKIVLFVFFFHVHIIRLFIFVSKRITKNNKIYIKTKSDETICKHFFLLVLFRIKIFAQKKNGSFSQCLCMHLSMVFFSYSRQRLSSE